MADPISIVEVRAFMRQAAAFLSEAEVEELKWYLANQPTAGVVIRGTGGVRKLRWSASGRGKRGGSRVIYFFHNDEMPLFLLAAYPKNVKTDLSLRSRRSGSLRRSRKSSLRSHRGEEDDNWR